MEKGYTLVEPPSVARPMVNPKHFEFAVAILHWAIARVKSEFKDQLEGIEIEVIPVERFGIYVGIGVHQGDKTFPNMGPFVEAEVDRVVKEGSLLDFIQFMKAGNVSWAEETKKLLASGSR